MAKAARLTIYGGLLVLGLSVFNAFTSDVVTSSFLRAEVLASMSGVVLMLIGTLWIQITPLSNSRVDLIGENGLIISNIVDKDTRKELGWGSHLFLTATPAASILVRADTVKAEA